MKLIVCLVFHSFLGVQCIEPRSVNLDIQATMVLQPGDKHNTLVDKLRKVLSLFDNSVPVTNYRSDLGVMSTFVTKLVDIITGYDEAKMNEVLRAIPSVSEYIKKISNNNIRLFMINNILRWSKYQPLELKKQIITFSKDPVTQYLVNNFDKFYDDIDKTKLDSIITMLKSHSDLDLTITEIFQNLFKVCFFDKYTNLNGEERKEFDKEIIKLRAVVLNKKDEAKAVFDEINEKRNKSNEIAFDDLKVEVRGVTEDTTESPSVTESSSETESSSVIESSRVTEPTSVTEPSSANESDNDRDDDVSVWNDDMTRS